MLDLSATNNVTEANLNALTYFNGVTSDAKNQLVANIVDFCDSDNIATITGTSPNFRYGNELTPYLNEVTVRLINQTDSPGGANPATTDTTIGVDVFVEVVNMFKDLATSWGGSGATITLNVTVNYDRGSGAGNTGLSISYPFTITGDLSDESEGYISLKSSSSRTGNNSSQTSSLTNISVVISDIKLYKTNAVSNAVLWDVADVSKTINKTGSLNRDDIEYCSIQAADPRDNQDDIDWAINGASNFSINLTDVASQNLTFNAGDDNWDVNTTPSTITADNENWAPDTSNEELANTKPWNISTAYMPENGASDLRHLHELGCIHRGDTVGADAPLFRTLNLVDYNLASTTLGNYEPTTTLDLTPANLAASFNGGDRALLDEMYISGNATTTAISSYKQVGPINPNSTDSGTITMLLSGIKHIAGPEYEQSAPSTSTAIDASNYVNNFPGIEAAQVEDFLTTTHNFMMYAMPYHHNRNPQTIG